MEVIDLPSSLIHISLLCTCSPAYLVCLQINLHLFHLLVMHAYLLRLHIKVLHATLSKADGAQEPHPNIVTVH